MIEIILKRDQPVSGFTSSDDSQSYTLNSLRLRLNSRPRAWRPLTDVYEVEDALVVRVEIAGMKDTDFSISLHGRQLLIVGVRSDMPERRAYFQMEILFGEFAIEFELPAAVEENHVEAFYRDGFLKVILPKVRSHLIRIEE